MANEVKNPQLVQDDEVIVLSNEFDQIRQCIGMYIGIGETEGAMHLLNEVVTNSIDESVNPEVIRAGYGGIIELTFDEEPCVFTVKDNGRGMPLDKMPDLIGHKHAGTKFRNLTSANRYSGGQNGVGITVTAALSDMFEVTCWRNGQKRNLSLVGNTLEDSGICKCKKDDKHGTETVFAPSHKWIGHFNIECSDVENYLRRLSYILPERVTIKYVGNHANGQVTKMTYRPVSICASVEYLGHDLVFDPIGLEIPEVVVDHEDKDPDFFKLAFAFSYDRSLDVPIANSFCNYIYTKDGGYHEIAVQRFLAEYFVKKGKELDPQHKYEITQDDCKYGLVYAVNLDHSNPQLEGQHKSRVGQRDIPKYLRKPMLTILDEYFESNNAMLRRIIGYLHQVAKARVEMNKVKVKAIKKPSTFLDDADMKIFSNISDRNYSGYKELILAEGDSAISAIGAARNVICQAILGVTGVVTNTLEIPIAKAMMAPPFDTLVKVLGCGYGETLDLQKLKWDAVIIASDSDADGKFITSLLCIWFCIHMAPLVRAGRLYKVIPPLYRIDPKSLKKSYGAKDYLFDKKEYFHLQYQLIADNMEIGVVFPEKKMDHIKGNGPLKILKREEKIRLMHANMNYSSELDNLARRSSCNIIVLEYICYFWVITSGEGADKNDFIDLMTKKFPELSYDPIGESFSGSYMGENVSVIMDDIFFRMAKRMIRLMAESPAFFIVCKNKDDKLRGDDPRKDKWDLMSYGEFIRMASKAFDVAIVQRYKGLGEIEALMLFQSMMNPKTRKLIRITMDDAERCYEQLYRIHGNSPQMREIRRQMLDAADITMEDIDN